MGKCRKGLKRGVLASMLASMAVDAKTFDRTNTKVVMEVVTYETKADLWRAEARILGRDALRTDPASAFAQWNEDTGTGHYWCTIHILERMPLDDLAHEIKHCLKGEWHK